MAALRRAPHGGISRGDGAPPISLSAARPDGLAVLSAAAALAGKVGAVAEGWNGLAVLHTAAARVGGLDLGFVPGANGKTAAEMRFILTDSSCAGLCALVRACLTGARIRKR